ncbi:pyridoxal phosphate-dependent transferase [Xylariaceae sp. FL0016]|nr:pyridoxal phosphate-dependent transferase [Xylariaceae sp. FL0016]
MTGLDMKSVRSSFPALGHDQVFFDNAGGSQTLGTVIDSICDYLSNTNVQLGASYKTGKAATDRYNKGREAGAKYINAQEDEIVFGSSTTQLYRNLSHALSFAEGDEIVVSGLDHEANIAPWVDLAERQKLVLKWWRPASSPTTNPKLEPADLEALLSPRTRLVTCTHASNILGTVTDVAAVAAALHRRVPAALLCVDAVAYAPHRPVDVRALGADFYAFSWYKVYGPHVSMLYASRAAQASPALRSLGHFFNPHDSLDGKLGLAGGSYELLQAVPAVLAYLRPADGADDVWAGVEAHEAELQGTLLDYLNARDDVTIYGDPSPDTRVRVATVSFTVAGWNSRDVVETVERETNFGFRWGMFYSNRLAKEVLGLGDDGVVRVSMVHYNTVEEIQSWIKAFDRLVLRKA